MSAITGHPRYRDDWLRPFRAAIDSELRPGSVVIDVGGGRNPAVARSDLPAGSTYVGIDLSHDELAAAPAGSYDRVIVTDITKYQPDLAGSADLIVSWQVLEHVAPLEDAISNMHAYLRPGALFVAQLSGGKSAFALINGLIPHRLAKMVLRLALRRDPESVFPAPYDRCTFSELTRTFRDWSDVHIVPRYRGAEYFRAAPLVQGAYLRFEDLVARGRHKDLATHYLIVARR